ncbi:retrovirus-related pol polyprotein from transposon TNT 1-94 [Tanacetum coccineum]
MMNELVRNQCDVTNHQVNVQFLLQLQPEWQRPQQVAIRNKGKAIVNSPQPTYDQEPDMVAEDDALSKEKEIDKLVALISLSFKKIYKPTNNNLRTSSNTSRANQDNTPRINKGTGYDNQRAVNVVGARENVASECQKTKQAKDAVYHKEKMLLCKQEKAGFQLNAKKANWRDNTEDELEDQELEAHYLYMPQIQEVTPDVVDNCGPIFDVEPLQNVQYDDDNYNVFTINREHLEQPEFVNATYPDEQGDTNITTDSLDMSNNGGEADQDEDEDFSRERDLLASLIKKLKCEIDESKDRNKLLESSNKTLVDKLKSEIEDFKNKNKCLESLNNHFKEANTELAKNNQFMFKYLKKFQAKLDMCRDVNYASKVEIDCAKAKGELISYKMSFEKSFNEYTQKINDLNQKISKMKKELIVHQETISIMSQEKEAQKKFYKTREDKEIEKVIALENKVKVLDDIVYKIGQSVQAMNMLNRCYNDNPALMLALESDKTIRLAQEIRSKLKEMVADLKYFNSLETEVDSLKSQLETQKTQFLNEIDRLSREYYYDDHMNAILGVYIRLDEVTNLQCDYLETLEKCEHLEKEFSKRTENLIEITLFIVDSRCSKHMTGNLKLLSNFVEKFMGTVKFGNDQITPILGYGDLVQGNFTVKKVYYVEGLNYNLFSVGQLCDADLEVAFRKSTCYIRDLKGNDILTGSCGTNLYFITLQDTSTPNPICLMAKVSSSQSWLWHRRLSHLNFDTINLLLKYDIVTGLPKLKFVKDHLCPSCELGKAKQALEKDSLSPGPQSQENVPQAAETVSTSNELDFLFSPMFDELLNGTTPVESKYTSIEHSNNTLNYKSSTNSSQAPAITTTKNINQAETNKENAQADKDEFINIFSTPVHEQGETSSRYVNSSNMHTFYQRHPSEHRWTKDHLLEQVIRNPSQSIRTRCQLETYGEMCMFALIVSQTEPKNIKESMADSSWIETMQEEIHQFE